MDTIHLLKVRVKSLASAGKHTRKEERKQLGYARFLCAIFPKKHPKDEPRAERPMPDYSKMFKTDADQQSAADAAYDKYWNLTQYRKDTIRREARSSLLAYAFLRDVPYFVVEPNGCYEVPDFETVEKIAKEYSDLGDNAFKARFTEWLDKADAHLRQANA